MDWIFGLLTTCTHHSEIQVIRALLLICTFYKSPQHPLSLLQACCVFNSRSLATASNSGDSSASRAHVVTVRRISRNWTLIFTSKLLHFIPLHSTELLNLIFLKITPRRGPQRKHRSSIVAGVFVSAGTSLPSRCLETGCITPLFYLCVHVCCGRYLATTAVYRVTS
jgi:hypothetical protein